MRALRISSKAAKFLRIGLAGSSIAIALGTAYFAGVRQGSATVLPVQRMPSLECYQNQETFSEVENTKATMAALSAQFLTELRSRHHVSILGGAATLQSASPLYAVHPELAIQEVEDGVEQFKGTEQEMQLTQELLYLLKKEQRYDRYVDVYLQALYRCPTHPLIGGRAKEARQISAAVARQSEVAEALQLLTRIPFSFPGKEQALASVRETQLAIHNSDTAVSFARQQASGL